MEMMRQTQLELIEVKAQLKPLNKALNYKIVAEKRVNKKQAILEKFRASQLLK